MVRERGASRARRPACATHRVDRDKSALRVAAPSQPRAAVAPCAGDVSVGTGAACGAVGHVMTIARRLALAFVALAMPVVAQDGVPPVRMAVPFGIGERADYSVKYGPFSVGSGLMEVVGVDTIRGLESWHTVFRIRGGIPGYRVDDRMESWMDTRTLASLRHRQELSEGSRERER